MERPRCYFARNRLKEKDSINRQLTFRSSPPRLIAFKNAASNSNLKHYQKIRNTIKEFANDDYSIAVESTST